MCRRRSAVTQQSLIHKLFLKSHSVGRIAGSLSFNEHRHTLSLLWCGIGRQLLTSQQNRLALWAAPLGSGSRGAMDLVAGPRGLSLDLWCGRQRGSRIIRYSAIKNDSGAILSSEVDASHISVRTLGSQFHEFWQATAPGIKRGLSWSGVPDQHGIP